MSELEEKYTLGRFPIHKDAQGEAKGKEKKLTIARFVDISTLAVGLGAYSTWLASEGKKPDALMKKGVTTARRYRDQMTQGFEKFVAPLMDRGDAAKLKIAWRKAMRPGSPDVMFARRGEFFKELMPWLRRHQQVMRDLFSGKSFQAALKLSQAVAEDSPGAILNKLAAIPPVSGLRAPRKFNEDAAKKVGAPITDTESVMADASDAQAKVSELRDAQTALDNADPGSEDEANAAAKKASISNEIEEIAAESKDPSAIRATVISANSGQPDSEIGTKAGLTPEQMNALVADGRIIITAGAGSGKTRVLAAKVAHYVQEKGYRPEQIMATSFTRKSATELKDRVAKNFGITEANIGTTHSIASQIIRSYRPQWQNAMKAAIDTTIERIFTIAMAQVQLDPSARSRGGWGGRGRGRRRYAGRNIYKDALGQWFNLGERITDERGKPIGKKRLKNFIGKWKMGGWGPDQAWDFYKGQRTEYTTAYFAAAVYGAYEYLKNDDPEFSPAFDFDDWLLKANQVLEEDPDALENLQRRYKVVLVDEAQDLNNQQHKLFGMIAEKADTYALIGDDKQCVAVDTPIATPTGEVRAGDLRPGDEVLAYRNGKVVPQRVKHVVPSAWTHGYKIRTAGGRTLLMSPNHKIWASEPQIEEGQVAVYLMHRPDMGFRVGVTKGRVGGQGHQNSYGGRAFLEKADRLWILDISPDRDSALLKEAQYSLRYGIPTAVFNGEHRDLDQVRFEALFDEFGRNGMKLLEQRCLSFDLPHWMSQSYTKHGRERQTLHINAHAGSNTQVSMEWSGAGLDEAFVGLPQSAKGNAFSTYGERRRIRRYFANYREALAFADEVRRRSDVLVSERLSTPEEHLRLITAAGLHIGMRVAVMDEEGQVSTDTIEMVSDMVGEFVDLDVDDASNFFGGGVLSHNSIYAFRGAVPEEFIGLPEKGFENKQLTLNFRSGSSIVEAANKLIAHNERQIPMECQANVERKGMGQIRAIEEDTHEKTASLAASEIADHFKAGLSPEDEKAWNESKLFGVVVRNNAEADAYALSLMARGIPFRTKVDFFNKPIIKATLAWMTINAGGTDEEVNDAIVAAHQTPGFFLDKKFGFWLGKRVGRGENYLDYLLGGGPVYDQEWRDRKMVAAYRDVVAQIADFEGDTEQVIRRIMDIQGSKQSFEDSLIEQIDVDDMAEDLGREPTQEEIREAALVPIRPVLAVADNFKDPKKMMDFIHKLQRANRKTRKTDTSKEPAVPIMTGHSWKGLEAKHIYVSMAGEVFPPNEELMQRDAAPDPIIHAGTMEDERRLAYVAITRGEDSVTIMSPLQNYRGQDVAPSRFIEEACIGVEGQRRPEENDEAAEDSPPPGRTASSHEEDRLTFADILDGFLRGASWHDLSGPEDTVEPDDPSPLEKEWEFVP